MGDDYWTRKPWDSPLLAELKAKEEKELMDWYHSIPSYVRTQNKKLEQSQKDWEDHGYKEKYGHEYGE